MRRGRETAEHIAQKQDAYQALIEAGWICLPEHLNCDLCAIEPEIGKVLCVEIERSPRNLENNLKRNIRQGADAIAVITPHKLLYNTQARTDRFNPKIPVHLFPCVSVFKDWLKSDLSRRGPND